MKDIFKGFGIFLSVLVSIAITVITLVTLIIFATSSFVTKNNLTNVIKDIDINEVIAEDEMMAEIKNSMIENGVTAENVDSVLNSKELKNVIGGVLGSNIESILKNNENLKMSDDELIKLIDKNFDAITSKLNITDEEIEEVKEALSENVTEINTELNKYLNESITEISNENEDIFELIRLVFSVKIKLILVAIIIGLSLLVALLRWSFKSMFNTVAIPFTIAGVILVVAGIFFKIMPLSNFINADANSFIIISAIVKNATTLFIIYGICTVILAVILFMIAKLISKKNKNEFTDNQPSINVEDIK